MSKLQKILFFSIFFLLIFCNQSFSQKHHIETEIETILINAGLVDIQKIDPSIVVDLKYFTEDNFLEKNMYGEIFNKAYLQPQVARKLAQAQEYLRQIHRNYKIIIYDAFRPASIQKFMWTEIRVAEKEKSKYVAEPCKSLHNYAAAVDVSIIDKFGTEIDMGSYFDYFGERAYPMYENELLEEGILSKHQIDNRNLLRFIMKKAGFRSISTEWWHFSDCSLSEAKKKYKLLLYHKLTQKEKNINNFNVKKNHNNVEHKKGIYFKIQILTVSKKINNKNEIFKDLEINEYYENGMYKYTSGEFTGLEKAYNIKKHIIDMGFEDAFIVSFFDGKKISLRQAIELMFSEKN